MKLEETSPTYNLGAIIHETGLNADTLRAWERRYNLPKPVRSAGGQRLYSPRDLEILKWLISKQKEGLRIGQAAKLWHNQVAEGRNPLELIESEEIVSSITNISGKSIESLKDQWVSSCKSFDEARAEQIISEAFSQYSPEVVCLQILFLGLSEIGDGWYKGETSVQQEHFASALVNRRLNALISGVQPPHRPEKIIVATPPSEEHTLAPLLITYLLRRHGWHVIYLGANVPVENFQNTVTLLKPSLVILTAQQLHTASNLLDMAQELINLSISLAFGGLIFNDMPKLRDLIPGQFLSENFENVVHIVERILNTPPPKYNPLRHNHLKLMNDFRTALPKIDSKVNELIAGNPHLQKAPIEYLSQDIVAALKFGNTAYLNYDLRWVQGLLRNIHIPVSILKDFLKIYYQALEEILGESSDPLLKWLQSEVSFLEKAELTH